MQQLTTRGMICALNAFATSTIAKMVSIPGNCFRSGTVSIQIWCLKHDLNAMNSAFENKVPKKTSHSTSSQMQEPDRSISKKVIFDFGKKHMISDTLIIKNIVKISPMKLANCFIPSCQNLGLPVIELNTISKKWIMGIRKRSLQILEYDSGLITPSKVGEKLKYVYKLPTNMASWMPTVPFTIVQPTRVVCVTNIISYNYNKCV